MDEPIVYLSGEMKPLSKANVSIFDLGLVQGASVTEMIRTFHHQPFRLDDHLQRLKRSLEAVEFDFDFDEAGIHKIVNDVVSHNCRLIPAHHDLGIVLFVTAGLNRTYVGSAGLSDGLKPTFCVHTFPLPFELWAEKLQVGQHLVTPAIRHIPSDVIDPRIKMRSRLHWFLADKQARKIDPSAGSLLLDHHDRVTETSSGNFFIVRDGVICTPSPEIALGGVSQMVVLELAEKLGIDYTACDLFAADVLDADESFTSSTPYCLLPVTRFNAKPIGDGQPGPVFAQLVYAWQQLVGVDIINQMKTVAAERMAG